MVGVRVGQSVGNADGESVGTNDGENERRSSVSFDGTAVGVCKRKYALARNTARAADAGVHGTPRLRRVRGVQMLASVQMRALASAQARVRVRVLSDAALHCIVGRTRNVDRIVGAIVGTGDGRMVGGMVGVCVGRCVGKTVGACGYDTAQRVATKRTRRQHSPAD